MITNKKNKIEKNNFYLRAMGMALTIFCSMAFFSRAANAQSGPPSGGSGSSMPGTNLSLPQLTSVFETLASNMAFRSVEPASGSADDWNFSFGLTVLATSGKKLKEDFPTADIPEYIPNADLYFGLQMPYGLTVELGVIPNAEVNGNKLLKLGTNLKWSLTNSLLTSLPFDLSLRAGITKPKLNIVSPTSKVDYDATITAASVSIGKKFGIIEPYVGFGTLEHDGALAGTGTVDLFGTPTTLTSNQNLKHTSSLAYGGMQIHLASFKIGLEYSRLFEIDNGAMKLGYAF